MCGRFTLRSPASVIAAHFGLFEVPPFSPRFNIAPSQPVPVVRLRTEEQSPPQREWVWLRWGLIPGWAKEESIGNRMINARAETVAEKPAYRAPFRRRRCLVVADGFYEWRQADPHKQPYYIRMRDHRPFAFAGLWDHWVGPQRGAIESCLILTTAANAIVRPLHDRMPVILAPAEYSRWLDPNVQEPAALTPLLDSYPAGEMTAYPVSARVNSPSHDDPSCIEPVAEAAQQQSLF
jgi:putative SOS response-associated peptidase YedK